MQEWESGREGKRREAKIEDRTVCECERQVRMHSLSTMHDTNGSKERVILAHAIEPNLIYYEIV